MTEIQNAKDVKLFALNSNRPLAQKIADKIAQEQGTGIYYKGAMNRIPGINA